MYIYIHTTGYLMMFSVIQSCYHSHSLLWTTKINFKYHKWPQCQNLETLVLFFSGRKKKLKIFSISLFLWLLVERDSVVTQRDPNGESRSHQSTWRWTVEFRGVLYESRKPFQDTAASTDVVNPHEAAACEGDVPLLGQVKHLLRINRVCDSLIP